jgi:RES domain-containing protein
MVSREGSMVETTRWRSRFGEGSMSTEPDAVQDLFRRVAACVPRAVELHCAAFRSAGVKYAHESDLLSGEGAARYGGRWNPRGVGAIYASLDPMTAVKESYHEFLRYGFAGATIRPRVFVGMKVDLECVLDLTEARTRRVLGYTVGDLVSEEWRAIQAAGEESWTQAIGRGAFAAGFEALLAPSARSRTGKILVAFPSNLRTAHAVRVMAADELPRHPRTEKP